MKTSWPRPGIGSRASCRTRNRCRTRCAIPSPISSASAPARQATTRCWRSPAKARSRTSACATITRLPARATLALTLPDELPSAIVGGVINAVASSGEQPDPAWDFVKANFDALAAKQGPSFRDAFVANFMTNFSDDAHAAELKRFEPAQATSGGRVMTARALETIAIAADLKTRALPSIDAWIREHNR